MPKSLQGRSAPPHASHSTAKADEKRAPHAGQVGREKPFDMLGANYKRWKLEMPRETFESYLRRDVNFYKQVWRTAMATPPSPPRLPTSRLMPAC